MSLFIETKALPLPIPYRSRAAVKLREAKGFPMTKRQVAADAISVNEADSPPQGAELNISFGTIKKSCIVSCRYDVANQKSRLVAWQACQELGLDLVEELTDNYNTIVGKVVQYEVTPGEVVFDASTKGNQSNRKKALAAVEDRLKESMAEPVVNMNEPEAVQ